LKLQLKRSSVLNNGVAKSPTDTQMEYGELAVNYNTSDPALFIKDSGNNIVRVSVQPTSLQTVTDVGNTTTNDISVTGDVAATTFTGDGSSLTGLPTSLQEVTDNGATTTNSISVTGTVTATAFSGDGSSLSGLPTSLQQVTDNGATTTHDIQIGSTPGSGNGVLIDNAGKVDVQAAAGSSVLWQGRDGSGGTSQILGNGNLTAVRGTFTDQVISNQTTGSYNCFNGQLNGTTKTSITAAGDATFSGTITAAGYDIDSLTALP